MIFDSLFGVVMDHGIFTSKMAAMHIYNFWDTTVLILPHVTVGLMS